MELEECEINSRFPYRIPLIRSLINLIGFTNWPSIYIHGPSGVGKTEITREVLKKVKSVKFVWVDCFEIINDNLLYNTIVNAFVAKKSGDDCLEDLSSSNQQQFVDKLMTVVSNESSKTKCVIVLDNADALLQLNVHLIQLVSKLHELLREACTMSTILISTYPPEHFKQFQALATEPIVVFFPAYSMDDLIGILKERVPDGFTHEFYENFIKLTLSVFHQLTNNLSELSYFCEVMFNKYIEPINSSGVSPSDSIKLWRNFEPHLRGSLDQFAVKSINPSQVSVELPFSSKFLLIAAYLASYNSVKTDKRFFVKNQGKCRSTRRYKLTTADKINSGPQSFTLERVYHIYKALVELNSDLTFNEISLLEPTVFLLSQLRTLVSLKLLREVRTTTTSIISSLTKFRIADFVTIDYMTAISKSVSFDLMAHLERFAAKS